LNEGLQNVTLSLLNSLKLYNTTTNATVSQSVNVYSFSRPCNILFTYIFLLIIAIPFLILGGVSLYSNGISAIDGGFIQLVATTRGSKTLDNAAGAYIGGDVDIPAEMLNLKLRFGQLADGGSAIFGTRRSGFGTEHEIIRLSRDQISKARYI
jgi:hypothetical protein